MLEEGSSIEAEGPDTEAGQRPRGARGGSPPWALSHGGAPVARAVSRAVSGLEAVPRPTATSRAIAPLVARADPAKLTEHGRLVDTQWALLWTRRLDATIRRARSLRVLERTGSDATGGQRVQEQLEKSVRYRVSQPIEMGLDEAHV